MPSNTNIRGSLESQGYLRPRTLMDYVAPQVTAVEPNDVDLRERAFLANVGDKTMIVSNARPRITAGATSHVMKLSGRFVGAEEPNRNGAMWTTGDLTMGLPTVAGGPLNWLHQEHHIVGAITDARLQHPHTEQAAVSHPYIEADATMWSFLRPAEAAVVQSAAEDGNLFYSMECVSRAVECQSCKTEFAYVDTVRGRACDHITERSAVRRFVDPVFLGGAVIVPPVRPGWADADLRVKASALAEETYDRSGADVDAAIWETLMAGLIKLAG